MERARTLLVGGMVAALLVGCGAGANTSDGVSASPVGPGTASSVAEADRDVVLSDGQLVLHADGDTRRLLALDTVGGEPVHATLRPGDHDTDTVLMLTRVDDAAGARYELRYLVATAEGVSELFWFPWRLQVTEELVGVLDVPPLPVWAPDGSAIAWLEWDGEGTRLRTVGWIDDGFSRNPSDDTSTYGLDDVPPGVQLERWGFDDAGHPELLGRGDGQPYRIQLALGRPTGARI